MSPLKLFGVLAFLGLAAVIGIGAYAKIKQTKCPDGTYVLEDGLNYYAVPLVTQAGTLSKLDVELDPKAETKMIVCIEVQGAGREGDRISRLACLANNIKTGKVGQVIIPYKSEAEA